MNKFAIPAIALVALIWAVVGYEMYVIFFRVPPAKVAVEEQVSELRDGNFEASVVRKEIIERDYVKPVSNPFRGLERTRTQPVVPTRQVVETRIRLSAISWDENNPEALLFLATDVNRTTHFVGVGDELGGERVLQITKDFVIVERDGQQFRVYNNRWERIE